MGTGCRRDPAGTPVGRCRWRTCPGPVCRPWRKDRTVDCSGCHGYSGGQIQAAFEPAVGKPDPIGHDGRNRDGGCGPIPPHRTGRGNSAGCALQCHRHPAPPSRNCTAPGPCRHRQIGRPAKASDHSGHRDAGPWGLPGGRHLFPATGRRTGPVPARAKRSRPDSRPYSARRSARNSRSCHTRWLDAQSSRSMG